jgi:hypothetical protein
MQVIIDTGRFFTAICRCGAGPVAGLRPVPLYIIPISGLRIDICHRFGAPKWLAAGKTWVSAAISGFGALDPIVRLFDESLREP